MRQEPHEVLLPMSGEIKLIASDRIGRSRVYSLYQKQNALEKCIPFPGRFVVFEKKRRKIDKKLRE